MIAWPEFIAVGFVTVADLDLTGALHHAVDRTVGLAPALSGKAGRQQLHEVAMVGMGDPPVSGLM
jgi:hypothetical protein